MFSTIVNVIVRIPNSDLLAAFIIKENVNQNTDIFFHSLKFKKNLLILTAGYLEVYASPIKISDKGQLPPFY